jgi:glutamyl-tRNA synthetase
MHLGNARTALFSYLYAKHRGGRFLLRIEDTDMERLVEGAEAAIYRDLRWLGIEWDEGPDVGGPVGPYRCSERSQIYSEYLKKLQKVTRVYRCFATPEELEQDRKLQMAQGKPIKYSGRYRNLSDAESQKRADAGEKFVWRMYVDEKSAPIQIQDLIRDDVTMESEVIGDFVLCRSNGVPVFLFANAIDDALMEITHVTRGEDHLSNTFRQVLIFKALGFPEPKYAHLPMIGDSDGGKFSKRAGSLSIENLRDQGYLKEGIINYMCLLGWSPGNTEETGEKFTKEQLIQLFDLERVHKGRALFDFKKLDFLNSQHLQDKSLEELARLRPAPKPDWESIWPQAIALVKPQANTLLDLDQVAKYLESPDYSASEIAKEVLSRPSTKPLLEKALSGLRAELNLPIEQALPENIKKLGKELNLKGKDLYFPFRIALTGSESGPELVPMSKVLGRDSVLGRIEQALRFASE